MLSAVRIYHSIGENFQRNLRDILERTITVIVHTPYVLKNGRRAAAAAHPACHPISPEGTRQTTYSIREPSPANGAVKLHYLSSLCPGETHAISIQLPLFSLSSNCLVNKNKLIKNIIPCTVCVYVYDDIAYKEIFKASLLSPRIHLCSAFPAPVLAQKINTRTRYDILLKFISM